MKTLKLKSETFEELIYKDDHRGKIEESIVIKNELLAKAPDYELPKTIIVDTYGRIGIKIEGNVVRRYKVVRNDDLTSELILIKESFSQSEWVHPEYKTEAKSIV